MAATETLRVGFVGTGGIARRHLGYCHKREDVELVGYADTFFEAAEKTAAEYGGNAYRTFDELYSKEKPDALVICTPPFAHGDIEEAACEAGIPFFVEKPVAVNMALANRVQRAVARSGVATQVGYMFRFAAPILKVRELLQAHPPAMVQAHYYMPGLPPRDWWRKLELGGGQLIEQATHMVDLARFLAGDVKSVSARTARTRDWTPPADYEAGEGLLRYADGFEIPDTTALVMEYESGALGTLSCSLVPQAKWDVGFKVVAEDLLITIDGANCSWSGIEEGSMQAAEDWPSAVLFELLDAAKAGSNQTSVPYIEGVRSLAPLGGGIRVGEARGRPGRRPRS